MLALLGHPLVKRADARVEWLKAVRALDLHLRGPRPAPGLANMAVVAGEAGQGAWWDEVSAILSPMLDAGERLGLADALDLLAAAGEALCGEGLWEREDGRTLARFVETLRLHARAAGTSVARDHLGQVLRDAMDRETVRPPYGAHARVAIYGLLESRMTRADLVICAGLNEGTWPAIPASDPVLAPAILRTLGVPGADFRIGLSAHDLAGALGAPQVVLSRSRRDAAGPVIASRFWLRVCALLGELLPDYQEHATLALARAMDVAADVPAHPRPSPKPSAEQRRRGRISVTTLDRLRSDPYQFYAQKVLVLSELDLLDATPTAAWQGTLAHKILEDWHDDKGTLEQLTELHLSEMGAHPLMRALWRPRLMKALEWVQASVDGDAVRVPLKWEVEGKLDYRGVTITGTADRIDRLEGDALAIVDYKTGGPPSKKQVSDGFSMQLGTLGLMAADGAFNGVNGHPTTFEYWSLGKSDKSDTGFGYVTTPLKIGNAKSGIEPDQFLPEARRFLDEALDTWILGSDGFTARLNPDAKVYTNYDQLMRLDEWMGREEDPA